MDNEKIISKIRLLFLQLKKYSKKIYYHYKSVNGFDFDLKWEREKTKIMGDINSYEKTKNDLKNLIEEYKSNFVEESKNSETLSVVEPFLEEEESTSQEYIKVIKETAKKFHDSNFEMDDENGDKNEIVDGLFNEKMDLEQRKIIMERDKKELNDLTVSANQLKYFMENMGLEPTQEQQQLFDKVNNFKFEYEKKENGLEIEEKIKPNNQNVNSNKSKEKKNLKKKCLII